MFSPFDAGGRSAPSIPSEERRVLRRSRPERLRFEPPGAMILPRAVIPLPRPLAPPSRLRVRLGRFLAALGHRLAGPDIAP